MEFNQNDLSNRPLSAQEPVQGGSGFVPPSMQVTNTSIKSTTVSFATKFVSLTGFIVIVVGAAYIYFTNGPERVIKVTDTETTYSNSENKNNNLVMENEKIVKAPFACIDVFNASDIQAIWKKDVTFFDIKDEVKSDIGLATLGCTYSPKDKSVELSNPQFKSVSFLVSYGKGSASPREVFDLTKTKMFSPKDIKVLKGVGVDAFTVRGPMGDWLYALSSNEKNELTIVGSWPADSLIPIAKAIDSNLNKY
jgi:hypothetical protein